MRQARARLRTSPTKEIYRPPQTFRASYLALGTAGVQAIKSESQKFLPQAAGRTRSSAQGGIFSEAPCDLCGPAVKESFWPLRTVKPNTDQGGSIGGQSATGRTARHVGKVQIPEGICNGRCPGDLAIPSAPRGRDLPPSAPPHVLERTGAPVRCAARPGSSHNCRAGGLAGREKPDPPCRCEASTAEVSRRTPSGFGVSPHPPCIPSPVFVSFGWSTQKPGIAGFPTRAAQPRDAGQETGRGNGTKRSSADGSSGVERKTQGAGANLLVSELSLGRRVPA